MWPYFIPILLCFFSCIFFSNNSKFVIKGLKKHYIHVWMFLLYFLIVFAGMRGDGSGDYWEYLSRGREIQSFADIFTNTIHMNYGYCAIALVINILELPAQVIIIAMNCISILCVAKFIKRYSLLPMLSVLLFLPFFFQFDMHAARSACAMGILTLATPYVISRKFFRFIFVLFIAILFHPESIIGIFIYFLPMMKINIIKGGLVLLIDLIIAIPNLTDKICLELLSRIGLDFFYIKFMNYIDELNDFSYETHLYDPRFIIFGLLFIFACMRVEDKRDSIERLVRNAAFFTIFLMIFFVNHAFMVFRFSAFYAIYSLILIPYILTRYKEDSLTTKTRKLKIREKEYYVALVVIMLLSCMYALRLNIPYKIFELVYW